MVGLLTYLSLVVGQNPDGQPRPVGPTATLATISEEGLVGTLVGVSASGVVLVARASGSAVRVPLDEVIKVTLRPPDRVPSAEMAGTLFLATGDRLRGRVLASDRTGVTFESAVLGKVKIGFERLVGYLPARPRSEPAKHKALVNEVMASNVQQDQVYLASGDRIPGVVETLTPSRVVVSGPLGRSEHASKDVTAIAFSREGLLRGLPDTLYTVVTFVDGSVLAAQMKSMSRGTFRLAAIAGFNLRAESGVMSWFEVRNGRVVFLSELEPARITYVPYYNRVWPMRRDRSVWGRPLTIRGRTFTTGLGLAPRTTLVYRLDGKFDRLEAQVGIDEETRGRGNAVLRIVTDGRQALNRVLTGGQDAVPINVPLAGIQELALIVDFGDDTDLGDHVDLGDARLVRARRK